MQLLQWLETHKDLALQACLTKNPSDYDIEVFISGTVWKKPLKKHINILDYDMFQDCQFKIKALKTFIAKSLEIHIEYLIADSNKEDSDYSSIVLDCIKELDNITIDFTFSATSSL
ncbi:28602_t:CDS:2 [Dentiscutata erythropus]|uniref:28602_t:CDS:1 n=1 Tax=Dentiscutata erythropus TaxID=1348616 RepID=A0A9N9GX30_9GLOM|nr:28602_t:CDS:2 [Dentiscutata erythropus]